MSHKRQDQVWINHFREASEATLREIHQQQLARIPKKVRGEAVQALTEEDDPAFLCRALQEHGPAVLADPYILECLRILWASAPNNKDMRKDLSALCSALAYVGGGRRTQQSNKRQMQIRHAIIARSKARARWLKRFDTYRALFTNADHARRQMLMEFDEKARFKNPTVKKLVREDLLCALNGER
jgi:hypothetical protein